jgi:GDPmannose 4,6-dehydratase
VIATGESHSVEEFLDLASEYAGLGDWHKFVEFDERMNRPTDIEELVGDSTKARKQFGWSPKVGFKELVKMMVEYDINNLKSSIAP